MASASGASFEASVNVIGDGAADEGDEGDDEEED